MKVTVAERILFTIQGEDESQIWVISALHEKIS